MPSPVSTEKSARWYNSQRFRADDPWAELDPATLAIVLIDMINWQAHPEGSSAKGMLEVGLTSARGITTLVLGGVVTNACVFLTAGAGFDLGYRQYVLSDGTAAFTEADQASAERFMDSYVAQVVRSEDLIGALERFPAVG
jgi:nicotinamidase-related amidase